MWSAPCYHEENLRPTAAILCHKGDVRPLCCSNVSSVSIRKEGMYIPKVIHSHRLGSLRNCKIMQCQNNTRYSQLETCILYASLVGYRRCRAGDHLPPTRRQMISCSTCGSQTARRFTVRCFVKDAHVHTTSAALVIYLFSKEMLLVTIGERFVVIFAQLDLSIFFSALYYLLK